jgi:hypothetical protein
MTQKVIWMAFLSFKNKIFCHCSVALEANIQVLWLNAFSGTGLATSKVISAHKARIDQGMSTLLAIKVLNMEFGIQGANIFSVNNQSAFLATRTKLNAINACKS